MVVFPITLPILIKYFQQLKDNNYMNHKSYYSRFINYVISVLMLLPSYKYARQLINVSFYSIFSLYKCSTRALVDMVLIIGMLKECKSHQNLIGEVKIFD